MKKRYLTFLLSCSCFASASAQHFYYRIGTGYDFPLAGSVDGDGNHFNGSVSYLRYNDSVYESNYKIKKTSFASGVHAELAAGYMFNDNLGLELDASLGLAPAEYSLQEYNIDRAGVPTDVTIKMRSEFPVLLIPSFILQTGKKVNFYTRMGLVLPLFTRIKKDDIYINEQGTGALRAEDFTHELSSGFSLGISAAAGFKFAIKRDLYFFGEINMLSMSLYAKQDELTNISVNGISGYASGVSFVSTVPSAERIIYYSKNANVRTSDPYHRLTYSIPYSSIGVHAGITFRIRQRVKHYKHTEDGGY